MESVYLNDTLRMFLTVVVIFLIIYIVIRFRSHRNKTSTSLEIMKERFERGEISEEAYERAKKQQGEKDV